MLTVYPGKDGYLRMVATHQKKGRGVLGTLNTLDCRSLPETPIASPLDRTTDCQTLI